MTKHTIISNFKKLIDKVKSSGEKSGIFKIRNYNKAIGILKLHDTKNFTLMDYKILLIKNGFSNPKKILRKIEEILDTGKLKEVMSYKISPEIQAEKIFKSIYAIGPSKAKQLVSRGIYSISELRKQIKINPQILNIKQKIGLKYYEDLLTRIPRKEIDLYQNIFKEMGKRLNICINIAGSYRRGVLNSGDIDLLITSNHPQGTSLNMIVNELEGMGIIKEVLANGKKKFMGITKIKKSKRFRHLDIVETSKEDYPFALLYFTGSGEFNIRMRHKALTFGYSLNEYNITYKGTKKRINEDEIEYIIGKKKIETEKDIFDFLDMKFILPKNRK